MCAGFMSAVYVSFPPIPYPSVVDPCDPTHLVRQQGPKLIELLNAQPELTQIRAPAAREHESPGRGALMGPDRRTASGAVG